MSIMVGYEIIYEISISSYITGITFCDGMCRVL